MTRYRKSRRRHRRRRWLALPAAGLLIAASFAATAPRAYAGDDATTDMRVVVVRTQTYASHLYAYAAVAPIASLRLHAATAGVVRNLDVLPGAQVPAGATLARLTGPEVDAALASKQARLASAEAALVAAGKSLQIEQQNQRGHLATRQQVAQAEAAMAEAQARLDDAKAQLATVRRDMAVQAPAAGQVLSVAAANGERVAPGQVLVTLQRAGDLWLKAAFYGSAATAVQLGMTGRFQPADGGKPIAVTVRSVLGVVQAGGGMEVGCVPAAAGVPGHGKDALAGLSQPNAGGPPGVPGPAAGGPSGVPGHTAGVPWHNGEAGTLVLDGASGSLPAVPTRALVLDHGRWWVMLHTSQGDRRQAVVLGPGQGDDTLIRHGLSPGDQVVVDNVYLESHRDFAQHYQQPD